MDKKKVREAICCIKSFTDDTVCEECDNYDRCDRTMVIDNTRTAIEALEKQLPKKPIIKTEKEVPHTHNLGRLLRFHCPNCGKFIVAIYESDTDRGGGISNSLKGCSTCLQAIDFSKYYTKRDVGNNKLNEDIEWSN
jgi:hypothetical protein